MNPEETSAAVSRTWSDDREEVIGRLTVVEQKVQQLADDARTFARKGDLQAFPTKKDAEAFATKEDLKAFATRDDLERSHVETRRHVEVLIEALRDDIRTIAEGHVHLAATVEQLRAEDVRLDRRIEQHDLRLLKLEAGPRGTGRRGRT